MIILFILSIEFVGNWPFGPSYAVEYDSITKTIFLGSGGGIYILDANNIDSLVKLGEIRTIGGVGDIFYRDSLLYVKSYGLEIYNVSDLTNPVKIGECLEEGNSLIISDTFAYILRNGRPCGFSGLIKIINISDPNNPYKVGEHAILTEKAISASIYSNFLFVRSGKYIYVIDVSIPSNPQEVDTFSLHCDYYSHGNIAISGNYLYTPSDSGFTVIDISDPTNSFIVYYGCILGGNNITIYNNYAYVTKDSILYRINTSNPLNPQLIDSCITFPSTDIKSFLDYVFISSGKDGMRIITTSPTIHEIGYYSVPQSMRDIKIKENHAFILDTRGLRIIDVSNPSFTQELFYLNLPAPKSIDIENNYAYIGTIEGLKIIDIYSPNNPIIVGSYFSGEPVYKVDVYNNYAYIAEQNKIKVINVEDVNNPFATDSLEYSGCYSLLFINNYLYCCFYSHLYSINVTDPFNISTACSLDIHIPFMTMVAKENYIYGSSGFNNSGVKVIDISNPNNITLASYWSFTTGVILSNLDIALNYLHFTYFNDYGFWLSFADVSDINNIDTVENYYLSYPCYGALKINNEYIYLATWFTGLQIYKNTLLSIEEKQNCSNYVRLINTIVRKNLEVEINLVSNLSIRYEIYNITGNKLITSNLNLPQGNHKIIIDCINFSSGIYFIKFIETKSNGIKFLILK